MLASYSPSSAIKRTSTWVLFLYVLSWMNIGLQSPEHRAMQINMAQMASHTTAVMTEQMLGMDDCDNCPPALCKIMISLSDQNVDNKPLFNAVNLLDSPPIYDYSSDDMRIAQAPVQLIYSKWRYRHPQSSPLRLNNILII